MLSKVIHFRASCEPCRPVKQQKIQLTYSWNLFHSLEEIEEGSHPKWISNAAGYPDFRVTPLQYETPGLYRIFVKLEGTLNGDKYSTLGESYYDFRIPNSPVTPVCHITPLEGIAMITNYTLVCNEITTSHDIMYEIYIEICHNCDKDDSRYVLFDRGYQRIFQGENKSMIEFAGSFIL